MTEHYIWDFIVLVSGIVSGAYISLRIQKHLKKSDTDSIIKNMKDAIKKEIQENMEGIKDEELTTNVDGRWSKSELKYLTIASYDSSVKSGHFILLDAELRKKISELYTYVHLANYHSDQLVKSQFIMADDTARFEIIIKKQLNTLTGHYKVIITKSEEILKKL